MPNRLAQETSPYLLQHKDNPIDWWPWCDEAWELAIQHDRPVFLSVGYSSCHWCHVMAHESFEDQEVAAALNRDFVCIKLDREERPDIDEVYMTAVQISNGHGGWPMSVFLTPDKKPFFAGTYFPKDSRGEFPGFLTIIGSLAKAWHDQRKEIQKAADDFGAALSGALERTLPTDFENLDVAIIDHAVEHLHQDFDEENGGFGGRPKFPPHATLRFLLDYASVRHEIDGDFGDLPDRAGHMALWTLEKIALGGIHDHVGGGFHRYSTDEHWLLPHFEKMLYDNAQLIGAFHHAFQVAADDRLKSLFRRAADRAVAWAVREMRGANGQFYSALDADSEGREGAFYVWHSSDLPSIEFKEAFQVQVSGNFLDEATHVKTGENVLHLMVDSEGAFDEELADLLAVRSNRPRPGLDDKAIAAWNGLMVSALAQSGHRQFAEQCAEFWSSSLDGRLPHIVSKGKPAGTPFLDDLAMMADGFLDLWDLTEDRKWYDLAGQLADQVIRAHADGNSGFFYVPHNGQQLFGRSKPFLDNACPSPNGVMARVLRRLGRTDLAIKTLMAGAGWMQRAPRATETLLREVLWHLWGAESSRIEVDKQTTAFVDQVTMSLSPSEVGIEDDGWGYTEIVVRIPPGVHINSDQPLADWLVPLSVNLEGVYGEASFPESIEGAYRGEVLIPIRLRPKTGSSPFRLIVKHQACTESECLLPQETVLEGKLVVS